jgi:hypothetical protein
MSSFSAVMLFPPNWSACVNGPHLALPLLGGVAHELAEWNLRVWDLNADFYSENTKPPALPEIVRGCADRDFGLLDKLYFAWEDSVKVPTGNGYGLFEGLLSGYSFPEFKDIQRLRVVLHQVKANGTVFTNYFMTTLLPLLMAEEPQVVALSISSSPQIIPALELAALVQRYLPDAFLVLGGNVLTRLRNSPALEVLVSLSDQLVLFQGEIAFRRILQTIADVGVAHARKVLPKIAGDQLIPRLQWPTPSFNGVNFKKYPGVGVVPYVSTRGCYWGRCHFCAIPAGWSEKKYAGSAPMSMVAEQIEHVLAQTAIPRFKFVDESLVPGKVRDAWQIADRCGSPVEWEAYARLEPAWEDECLLSEGYRSGLRKLYFGIEQAPSASRHLMNKRDKGDSMRILRACQRTGIAAHVFCMVGYPGTSRDDAKRTTQFLLDNQHLIDTADLVGFRLDRGTTVPGTQPLVEKQSDWALTLPYRSAGDGILSPAEVTDLEESCQEALWNEAPRLLHPLYRLVGPWAGAHVSGGSDIGRSHGTRVCSVNS